jgi:hypothetical protein
MTVHHRQVAPDDSAAILADIVANLTYKPGWSFTLTEIDRGQGCGGLTLLIAATVPNSLKPNEPVGILHLMPVIPAAYNRQAWTQWVLDQILLVEKHEAMEFMRINGDQPFFPAHAPGDDPYAIMQIRSHDEAHAAAIPWSGGPPSYMNASIG